MHCLAHSISTCPQFLQPGHPPYALGQKDEQRTANLYQCRDVLPLGFSFGKIRLVVPCIPRVFVSINSLPSLSQKGKLS